MAQDTLLDQLAEARRQCNEARKQMVQAKTKRARREAEEDLNFWQGKVAWFESSLENIRLAKAMLPIQKQAFQVANRIVKEG